MKDAFHGSAHPARGLVTTHRESTATLIRPYRGSSRHSPIRGTPRTAPKWITRAGGHCFERLPRIVLDLDTAWSPIPCWSGRARRWAHETVPAAYRQRYDTHVRPAMPNNPVSLKTLVAVAAARATFAEHRTGRNCRPTNARLAAMTGLSVRSVQRASTALRLLGVATEVMRGRQRTRTERYASWRVGDRGRGWASVWALHDSPPVPLSPHPEGSLLVLKTSRKSVFTTATRRKSAGSGAAARRQGPDPRAVALANKWIRDPQSPPWARRYRTGTPWAYVLSDPARHDWSPRDINQLISDWTGIGHWLPETPHKPIGLLGTILAWHGNVKDRPAAAEVAREEAERAERRERIAAQQAERQEQHRRRQAGRAARHGPGHRAAQQVLAEIAERTRQRRYTAPPQGEPR